MAQKTKNLWDDAVGDYKDYGFCVEIPNDYLLELYFKDNKIATFYQNQITPEIVMDGCENYLKSISKEF